MLLHFLSFGAESTSGQYVPWIQWYNNITVHLQIYLIPLCLYIDIWLCCQSIYSTSNKTLPINKLLSTYYVTLLTCSMLSTFINLPGPGHRPRLTVWNPDLDKRLRLTVWNLDPDCFHTLHPHPTTACQSPGPDVILLVQVSVRLSYSTSKPSHCLAESGSGFHTVSLESVSMSVFHTASPGPGLGPFLCPAFILVPY